MGHHRGHRRAEMSAAIYAGEPHVSRSRTTTLLLLHMQLSGQGTPVCTGLHGDVACPLDDHLRVACRIVELHVRVLGDPFACTGLVARARRTRVRYAVWVARERIRVLVYIIRPTPRQRFESGDADRRSSLHLRLVALRRLDNPMRVFPASRE